MCIEFSMKLNDTNISTLFQMHQASSGYVCVSVCVCVSLFHCFEVKALLCKAEAVHRHCPEAPPTPLGSDSSTAESRFVVR